MVFCVGWCGAGCLLIRQNNYVYCAAINACEREGNDWAMAMKFFDDMAR